MATYTWTGLGADGLWSTAGNWLGNAAPPTTDVQYSTIVIATTLTHAAVIPAGVSYSGYNALTLGGTATTATLNLLGSFSSQTFTDDVGGILNLASGGTLHAAGAGTINGTFNDAGSLSTQLGLTVGNAGSLNITSTGTGNVAGAITVNGTLDVAKGASLTGSNGLFVNGTASFEGTYVDSSASIGGTGTFNINGGIVGSSGMLTTISSGAPVFNIINGGSLFVTNPNSATSISFGPAVTGVTNLLFVPSSVGTVTAPLQNFGAGDAVELSSGQTISNFTATQNSNGTYTIKLNVSQYYTPVTLSNVTLAAGTTPSSLSIVQNGSMSELVGCFCAGTMLATPDGEIAVEDIVAGTMLLTADGDAKPVRWLGRTATSTRFADPLRTLPVRIKAGALAENLPVRDLLVSPCHALFIGGVLVQAGALVNGTSIVRDTTMPEVFNYYHVELATHELLLAEGALTESFIDNVDRMNFENWAEHTALGITDPIVEMEHPRAKAQRQVPASVRRLLADRAALFAPAAVAA